MVEQENEARESGRDDGIDACLRIAQEHLARFTPSAYAYGPLAALVADIEALR